MLLPQAIWLDHCGGVSTRLQQLNAIFPALCSPAIIALTFTCHDSPLQVDVHVFTWKTRVIYKQVHVGMRTHL